LKIKELVVSERPREKLSRLGPGTLTEAELLGIIIGTGNHKENAVQLANRVISQTGGVRELAKASIDELQLIQGIGEAKAISIVAAFELSKRKNAHQQNQLRITSSDIAVKQFQNQLGDLPHEEFWVLFLNRANIPIREICVSKGGVSGTVVDTKIITKGALNCLCSGVIVYHNHPSGNRKPSKEDIAVTKKIKDGLAFFDIQLLDHIIIAQNEYFSFADENMI
jgi:DNA repair protein RadC